MVVWFKWFSLRFSRSKFLLNLPRGSFVHVKFVLARNFFFRSLFILCLKLLFRKCVTYVLKQPPEVFCRCSWKFHKIHRKTPEPESLRPATLIKKRLWPRCLPVNFVKFLRTAFIIEYLWWLFLYETELYVGHRKWN